MKGWLPERRSGRAAIQASGEGTRWPARKRGRGDTPRTIEVRTGESDSLDSKSEVRTGVSKGLDSESKVRTGESDSLDSESKVWTGGSEGLDSESEVRTGVSEGLDSVSEVWTGCLKVWTRGLKFGLDV